VNTSVVREFLLFDLTQWVKYGNVLISFCEAAIFPIFIFSLLYDKIAVNQAPLQILKRTVIAQLILIMLPTYYQKIAGFGFDVADSVMKEQRNGLIVNWTNIKRKAERASKQANKPVDALTAVTNIFNFNANDVVEKFAGLAIYLCILLIKVIFSVVYYGTYSIIAIWSALAIMPSFDKNFLSIFKSILYIILTPILISLVLAFINESLSFAISADGFLETMTEMSKFLVLCFLLLGTLVISYSVINGAGIEAWASKMAGLTGASLPYAALSGAINTGVVNPSKQAGRKGVGILGSAAKGIGIGATSRIANSFRSSRPNKSQIKSSLDNLSKGGKNTNKHSGEFSFSKKSQNSGQRNISHTSGTQSYQTLRQPNHSSQNGTAGMKYSGEDKASKLNQTKRNAERANISHPSKASTKTRSYSQNTVRANSTPTHSYSANKEKIDLPKKGTIRAVNKNFGGALSERKRSSIKKKSFTSSRRNKK
jgi:hypothetical protein